ncbi:MAG: DNA polymerase [Hyphomicrobiales bacterium]|nr:MAG: DNA polymerase [Hyphomicrobiales bacterium]PCJ96875.1 MAG: DNA polymerase [Hyphomicrobiales bacterium]
MMKSEVIWDQKYRPTKLDKCILPFRIKHIFKTYLEKGVIEDNLILSGPPGLGKTTIAKAMMEELDAEYIFVNASLHGNIDTLRDLVQGFVTKVSLDGGRKYVIFDEAEKMTSATQDAMKAFIEENSKMTGFIFTCNIKSMITGPLLSRLNLIDFTVNPKERAILMKSFYKRILEILDTEEIPYIEKDIVDFMASNKNSLDFRKFIGQIQMASKFGEINAESLKNQTQQHLEELMPMLKEKDFNSTRKWLTEHPELGAQDLYREFYDLAYAFLKPQSIPQLVLTLGKYQYQNAFVMDQEINTAAFLVEVMVDCEFL